jgi:hypothetical protein
MDPLYIVIRNDLDVGLQMAQACHVTREFTREFPEEPVGDSLIVVACSPAELAGLGRRADGHDVRWLPFHEPDLGGELTAIALGVRARRLVSQYPRAGRDWSLAASPDRTERAPPACVMVGLEG